jgi:hypothetical protein
VDDDGVAPHPADVVPRALHALQRLTKSECERGQLSLRLFRDVVAPLARHYHRRLGDRELARSTLAPSEIDSHLENTWEGARACLLAAVDGYGALDATMLAGLLVQGETFCRIHLGLIERRHGADTLDARNAVFAILKLRAPLSLVAAQALGSARAASQALRYFNWLGDGDGATQCERLLSRIASASTGDDLASNKAGG